MLNDRDDKYEGSDDSEYHFSGDDVDYEAEPGSSKPASVTEVHADSARSTGGPKRIMIGLAVFFGLVFIAYKMVAPGSSVPTTDITPQAAAAVSPAQQQASAQQMAQQQPMQKQSAQQVPAVQQGQQTGQAPTAPEQQSAIQQMQSMVVTQQETDATKQMPSQQAAPDMSATQSVASQSAAIPQSAPAPANNAMPQMIPVQSSVPSSAVMASTLPPQVAQGASADEKSLAMENAKLSSQLQAEYAQRINDYQSQNRNLQDQVQTLNTRVANMESEMNQLIQTLTQQFQGGASAPAAGLPAASSPEQAAPPPRVPYTVQAIIPGRAWLRAKNGDTLTVAEGDDIKGIGRVTKIDPYDGVVEVNVQGRSVSLTYGN